MDLLWVGLVVFSVWCLTSDILCFFSGIFNMYMHLFQGSISFGMQILYFCVYIIISCAFCFCQWSLVHNVYSYNYACLALLYLFHLKGSTSSLSAVHLLPSFMFQNDCFCRRGCEFTIFFIFVLPPACIYMYATALCSRYSRTLDI